MGTLFVSPGEMVVKPLVMAEALRVPNELEFPVPPLLRAEYKKVSLIINTDIFPGL